MVNHTISSATHKKLQQSINLIGAMRIKIDNTLPLYSEPRFSEIHRNLKLSRRALTGAYNKFWSIIECLDTVVLEPKVKELIRDRIKVNFKTELSVLTYLLDDVWTIGLEEEDVPIYKALYQVWPQIRQAHTAMRKAMEAYDFYQVNVHMDHNIDDESEI